METVTSADGTVIAFDRSGEGEPIVFVSGAFNDRTTCAPVAERLRDRYTVICYDRRGRGDSTDAAPVSSIPDDGVRHEIDDLAAVIAAAGGTAAVFGFSSGGILALRAAAAGLPISRLALYEPPIKPAVTDDLPQRLAQSIIDGRRGDAVTTFQRDGLGLPPAMIDQARNAPFWPHIEAMATSTVYDATLTADDRPHFDQDAATAPPMIILNGAETWPVVRTIAEGLPQVLPNATRAELPGGANHTMPPEATAEEVHTFLARTRT